jgi:zinc protease
LSALTRSHTNGTPATDVLKTEEKIKALTTKDLQDVAKKYLSKDKVVGILMPEN